MIEKKIHYCWFGKGEMKPLMKKCLKSWKKYCPDYEIIEWNEENFDVNSTLNLGKNYGISALNSQSKNSATFPGYKVVIDAKFTARFNLSGVGYTYAKTKVSDDAEVVINNADSTPTFQLGGDNGDAATFEKDLKIDVKSAKSVAFIQGNNNPTVNGNFVAVINAPTITGTDILGNVTAAKKWIITNTKDIDGLISPTSVEGTFDILKGYKVTFSNGTDTQVATGSVTLTAGKWDVIATERVPIEATYYVAPGGTGDGSTAEKPAASVKDVVETAIAAGLTESYDTINVKIVGSSSGSAVTNYAVFVKPYKDSSDKDTAAMTAHEAKLVISPCDTEIAYLSNDWNGINTAFQLGGPTEFKSVNLHVHQYSEFLANGYDVSFDSNCAINNRIISAGKASYTKYSFVDKAQKLTFENALNNTIAFPNSNYVSNSTEVNFTKDQNIIIDNAASKATIQLGNSNGASAGLSGVLNIDVKSAKSIAFAKGNHPLDITGTLQVVVNADTIDVTALADFATAENAKKYIVTNATGIDGLISMTDTVGTYKIADGYEIIAVNGNTTKTATGSIELDAGTWNIVIAQTVTVTGGTADVEEAIPGATVTLTPNAPAKYMEFAGWEIVSGDATVDGNTLTMGNQAVEVKAIYKAIPASMNICDLVRFNECGADSPAIGEDFEAYLGMDEVLSLQLIRNWLLNAK